ncbi:hypothetical protein E4U53_006159 [Claviceps sorghi]|nr:hypothetical protein E4U53_006159 [Claviceps sorghi]
MYYKEGPGIHDLAAGASLVPLQSTQEAVGPRFLETGGSGHMENYSDASRWTAPFGHGYRGGAIDGYVPMADMPIPRRHFPERIQEEEYELSLLQSAAPIGVTVKHQNRYEAVPEDDETPQPAAFDITSAMGFVGSYDSELLRSLQKQEAQGTLTGGLGQGIHPASTLRDTELLASPGPLRRGLTKSFTRRNLSTKPLSRRQTIQYKGQDEANRRGQVIEVILETTPTEDLSNFEGSRMVGESESRRRRSASQAQKSAIFYPQPNWKPWSMRWPYLTMVILLSLALAGMHEVLFRKYKDVPLLRFQKPAEVTPGLYFAVKFAPTLSAVVYGVLWQFIDFEVRRLEAYYQLSKAGGALAAESINVDYVTSFNFYRPLRALRLGHYAVALSSIATTLAISLVPTFASASVILTPSRDERMRHPSEDKFIYFSPIWSRLLTSTLAVCAACGFGLLFLLQTRRTGLVSEVQGIAGLASMAVVSHILMDFKDTDTAKHKDIHRKLKYNRYVLRNSSLAPENDEPATSQERRGRRSKLGADDDDDDDDDEVYLSENPHPLMLRPAGFVPFIMILSGFTGFVPAFLFTKVDVVTEKAPWVVTAVAVCLKMSWNALDTAVRMMEPFYILSKRHAPSMTLSLDYTALPFGYLPLRALLNGHTIMFLVGMGSVMAEFLTILVTGLATVDGKDFLLVSGDGQADEDKSRLINSGQETIPSFYVSFGIAVFILAYMGVVSCLVFVRRRHPFLPRQPNTISSVLAYIHQSKMLYAFVGTDKTSGADTARRLLDGRDESTYGLGWFQGRDGQMHCGVDREELTSSYQHGVDVKRRNQPWNMQWDVL